MIASRLDELVAPEMSRMPFGIAGHVLEQQRRRLGPRVVHDLAERAHFELPVGALDAQDFARFLRALDELAQVLVRGL